MPKVRIDTCRTEFQRNRGNFDIIGAYNNGLRISTASSTLSMVVAGTAVTATNLFPVGVIILGVVTEVLTTVTGSGGTITALDVGDGSTADLYGNDIGYVKGTLNEGSIAPVKSTNRSVTVTRVGTATALTGGSVRVTAVFMNVEQTT